MSDWTYAVGIARIMQCGWYKEVRVKDLDSHAIRALLVSRALLVKIKRDIENQIRGLLRNLGLVIGRAKMNVFAVRAAELAEARPELAAAVEPLLKAREAVGRQIADLDCESASKSWTPIHTRRQHSRDGLRYETDLTDAEWRLIEPYLPAPCNRGRRRRWPLREILNAIFYVMRGGMVRNACATCHNCWRFNPKAIACAAPGMIANWRSGLGSAL